MKKTHSQLGFAFLLNLVFTVVEFWGGIFTNSIAIYSNALHDLGDTISLGVSYGLERLSTKKGGETFTYGYGRFSLLAALINGIVLVVGSVIILSEAIPRLIHPEYLNIKGVIWLAGIGLIVNALAAFKIKGGTTINAQMVRLHLMEDILSWSTILVVGIVLLFKEIPILDAILSILITLFILWTVVRNLRETFKLFLQGKPAGFSVEAMESQILAIRDVMAVHDMHIWSLDGERHVLTTHVVAKKGTSTERQFGIKCCVRALIRDKADIHVTIEMEIEGEQCLTEKTC